MNRIKELRQKRGLSIDQLSKELKKRGVSISPASISKYEREVRRPKIENWISLAFFFNVNVDYLKGKSNINNTGGYRMAPVNSNIDALKNFNTLFQQNTRNISNTDLSDGEKIRMVNTVYQLQYILSKYIPSNDDSFDDSHKKHIVINRINKLINNITNSLHDKDVDEVISILEKLDDVSKSKGDD